MGQKKHNCGFVVCVVSAEKKGGIPFPALRAPPALFTD